MIRALVWLFGIQSAVACVVIKDGKILLTKRSPLLIEGGKWCLPGGGIKRWEKNIDAAKRELFEETGLKSRSAEFLFVHEEMLRRLKLHAEVFVFNIETIGELKRNWEVSESKWFSRKEISKMNLAFTHKDIVNKYFKLKGVR
ncbi:NUDIX hydrolase [Candidatus Pacearchaeota archaeon]|nr:NUDIX hydrolase [Candidatus Pacearchaeota archaeon]